MKITYIGHATLLLEIDGIRILTDPNFDSSLGIFLRRMAPPGLSLSSLPTLDAILVTHAHADHLSLRSLRELTPRAIPVYAPPTVARWIRRKGIPEVRELPPGEQATIRSVTVSAAAAQHVGGRYGIDRWRHHSNMYLVATKDKSVFFAGDTAINPGIAAFVRGVLANRGQELDIALLPIGYAPEWKRASFRRGHLTSWDALELFEQLGAKHFIPYHWGTFNHVTSSAFDAITELREHMLTHTRGADVRVLEPGELYDDTK